MIYNNYYDISLFYNGNELVDLDAKNYSFSIHSSIFNFFSNAQIKVKDISGLLREYMFSVEGGLFKIKLGVKDDNYLESSYVVVSDSDINEVSGILSGNLQINLMHEYYNYQNIENSAYTGRISDIINNDIASDYKFSKVNINDTGSTSTWYRLGMNQKNFIEQVLLPNTYSNNSYNSPFFCFIDLDNSFNFRNYKFLYKNSSGITLNYQPIKQEEMSITTILDIKPFRDSSLKTKYLRNRTVVTRDYLTGDYIEESHTIVDNPSNKDSTLKVPIINDKNFVTDYSYFSFTQQDEGDTEALKARILYKEKEGFSLEKFVITTLFNPNIKAGIAIDINVSVASEDNTLEYGLFQSGSYLVEDCIHAWEGLGNRKAYTTIIVSRKFATIPNYTVKSLLI